MSKTVFLSAVDMNRPLRRYAQFQSLLMEKGFTVDMFVVAEGSWEQSLPEKLDRCSFIWVKSLDSITGDEIREVILDRVSKGANLLVNFLPAIYSNVPEDTDAFKINRLTEGLGIRYTNIKFHSSSEGREITLGLECLQHDALFKNVDAVSLSCPWHLEIEPPAQAVIVGDESCQGLSTGDRFVQLRGSDLVCAACSQKAGGGKVLVLSGLAFLDADGPDQPGTLAGNLKFASNLIDWLGDKNVM